MSRFFMVQCVSIFNYCDVIGLQSYWILWNNAK